MKRYVSCLLALLLVFSGAAGVYKPVQAAEKAQKTRSIAIVYDNSGSMYMDMERGIDSGGLVWCQALYAMEVFASMMNEGDSLWIYPMWDVTTKGSHYSQDNPVKVNSPRDAVMIRDIDTPNAGGTPISAVKAAYDGLKTMSGDEKWLIVLTDGTYFHDFDLKRMTPEDSERALSELISPYVNDVNVLFLGIGPESVQPSIPEGAHYASVEKAMRSEDVLSKLTSMCNTIFGRDELKTSGDQVTFDVSMKRLIVFVQGENVSNVSLRDETGKEAGTRGDELAPHFSEHYETYNGGNYTPGEIDRSLQGVIQNYSDSLAGSYKLDYSGSVTSIGVYYEPDVDLVVRMVDANGNDITGMEDLPPGEYQIEYGLVDAKTGEMTNSELLGNTHYDIHYRFNGEEKELSSDDKQGVLPLTIEDGDTLEVEEITVEYLSGYRIHKSGIDFGFPNGGWRGVKPGPDPAGDFEVRVSGGAEHYKLSTLEQEAPYLVEFYYNGEKMKAADVQTIIFRVESQNNGISFQPELDGDHYNVTVHYADPAHPENTECGDVVAMLNASYTEPEHEEATAGAAINFTLDNDVTGLGATLVNDKTRFTMAELDGYTMNLDLRMGGEPLTDQEMNDLTVDISIEEKKGNTIPYTIEKDPANSRVIIKLGNEGVKKGDYKIVATAMTKNQLGQDSTATDGTKIKVRLLPVWVIAVSILAALALIAALLWFILSRKVLPKKAIITNTTYFVDGDDVPGDAVINLKGARKKKGTIDLKTPSVAGNPFAKANFKFEVEAADTRYKVLKKKLTGKGNLSATVTNITSSRQVSRIMASGTAYNWDDNHQLMLPPGETSMGSFRIGTDDTIIMNAEAMDGAGGGADMNMTCTIAFK